MLFRSDQNRRRDGRISLILAAKSSCLIRAGAFSIAASKKSAVKQQIGEARKKRNSDDRRLRRIQGGAVGAAVSRTRVPLKARSGRWAPQPVLAQRLAFFRFDNSFGIIKGEQPLIRASRASKVAGAFLVLFWRAKENLALVQERSILRRRRKNHSSVICSPSSSARISAPVAGRLRTR